MSDCRLELGIYNAQDDENVLPIATYLDLKRQGKLDWTPLPDSSSIIFVTHGREWFDAYWNSGRIDLLERQFDAAADRLEQDREGIVRTGGPFDEDTPYFLFEPAGNDVLVSIFPLTDASLDWPFPIDKLRGSSTDLYAYVRDHRDELTRGGGPGPRGATDTQWQELKRVPCARAELIASLRREARLARELMAELGWQASIPRASPDPPF